MINKIKFLCICTLFFSSVLSACSKGTATTPAEVNKFPPFQTIGYSQQTNDTAKVKYAVADMQLGGTPVVDYYREYASQDPAIQQAVNYYDSGARIMNIYQFTRVEINNNEWQIIYGGTDGIVCQGDDIVLSTEIAASESDAFEAQIRYILADITLGDVATYYRQFTDQPAVAEAIQRWDAGVTVTNIEQFERRILVYAGWKIIYLGTDTPINGMDVLLSTDQPVVMDECAQLNLTPEQCANFGHVAYTMTRTVTTQIGVCIDSSSTELTYLNIQFPIPSDWALVWFIDVCTNSSSGNSVSYFCPAQAGGNSTFTGTLTFTTTGIINDYEDIRTNTSGIWTSCQIHEEWVIIQ
jgi:hypothetical protein